MRAANAEEKISSSSRLWPLVSQEKAGNESLIFFWHSFLGKDDFDLVIKNHSQSCIKVCCTHGRILAFYIPISLVRRRVMWLLGFNLRDAGEYQANFDTSSPPEEVSLGEISQLSLSNNLMYMGRPDDQLANQVALAKLGLRLDYFEPGIYLRCSRDFGYDSCPVPRCPARSVVPGR
jgi:hypothetical protein